jgi:ubiquinone biosynthesis protein UbiJ
MILNLLGIKLINLILETNRGSRQLLSKYSPKTFKLIMPGFSLHAQIDSDGFLINENTHQYSVIINIPLDSATFLINRDKLEVYKKLSFIGDTDFGRELLEIIAKLQINGIYTKTDSLLMMIALNKLTDLTKMITNYLKLVGTNGTTSIKEYLLYETQDLVTVFENNQFCDEVDEIHSRTELLEQQIQQYAKQGHNK